VARAFVEHKLYASGRPVKLFYMGPMFRYERPQAGRFRQHHQLGAEILGAQSPAADFEIIALLVDILTAIGLGKLDVEINSVGDAECRPAFSDELRKYLEGRVGELCPDCVRRTEQNPLRVLDCKVPGCRVVAEGIPSIQDHLCDKCRLHQAEVLGLLEQAGIPVARNDRLVRGLDYYTRTVFEVVHSGLGAQNAVGGGGRYDGLVEDVGGPATPGVGFSSGIERMLLGLESEGVELGAALSPQVTVVVAGEETERRAAMVLARRLRGRYRVGVDLSQRSLNAQMKTAGKTGSQTVVVVGSGELEDGTWTVKEMHSGEQTKVDDMNLEDQLGKILEQSTVEG